MDQPGVTRRGEAFSDPVPAAIAHAAAPVDAVGWLCARAGPISLRARRLDRLRRRGRIAMRLLASTLTLVAAMRPALADTVAPAKDDPVKAYDRQAGCAAIFAAASERVHDADLTKKMSEVIASARQEAQASGAAIGKSSDAVGRDIEARRRGILKTVDATPPASDARRKEDGDLGRVAIECALLHAMSGGTKP